MNARGEDLWRELARERTSSRASLKVVEASVGKQRHLTGTLKREISLSSHFSSAILGGERGTSGWSKCGVAPRGGGSRGIRVGASVPAGGVALSGRRVFLVGRSVGGELSHVVGGDVATLFG